MRPLLISLVLGTTALTFYSALWYKSEAIEDDITKRVSEELIKSGVNDVASDVDGRHVTLSGVVYSEDIEKARLKVAKGTYGALGPIDGLTVVQDTSYLSAIKTVDGLTLSGTVPNEAFRASLLEQAKAATDGDVSDKLKLSGPASDWQNEAGLGLGQLAALSAGTLSLSAGSYALSGTAQADPDAIESAFAGRDGWLTTISPAIDRNQLDSELNGLRAQIADRDASISGLTTDLGSATTELAQLRLDKDGLENARTLLIGERDTLASELDVLRGNLSSEQSSSIETAARLTAMTAQLSQKDADKAALTDKIALLETDISGKATEIIETRTENEALTGRIRDLEGQLGALDDSLGDVDTRIAGLTQDLSLRDGSIEALNGQLTGLQAELDAANAENGELTTELGMLKTTLATRTSERDAGVAERNELASEIEARNAELTEAGFNNKTLSDSLVGMDAKLAALTTESEGLQADLSERDATIASLRTDLSARDDSIAAAKTTIQSLTNQRDQLASQRDGLTGQVGDLTGELNAKVSVLETQVQERDGTIADLRTRLSDGEREATDYTAQLAALAATVTTKDTEADAYKARINGLETDLGTANQGIQERDTTIAALRNRPVASSGSSVDQCAARANDVVEGSRINFTTGTANLSNDSIDLLERLTGIALACVGDGVSLEVGGHTDSRGGEAYNQELSEARAQTVRAFMVARGVPQSGLSFVGYGETRPIADNETEAGRSANRRISFAWQAQ